MKRRWTKSVRARTADPVRVAKCEAPVGWILHELGGAGKRDIHRSVAVTLAVRQVFVGGSDPQRFQFAVEVATFQAKSCSRLRHVPAVLLQFPPNEFPLVGAAGFVLRRVRVMGAFRAGAEEVGGEGMR